MDEEVEEASTEIDKTYYEKIILPFETQWAISQNEPIPQFAIKEQFFDKDVLAQKEADDKEQRKILKR